MTYQASPAPVALVPMYPYHRHEVVPSRPDYAKVNLSSAQHAVCCVAAASAASALFCPIYQLQNFYFMSLAHHELPPDRKTSRLLQTIMKVKWHHGPVPYPAAVLSNSTLLMSHVMALSITAPRGGDTSSTHAVRGTIAGAIGGVINAFLRHPVDVLVATAAAEPARYPRGALHVLFQLLRHRPSALIAMYRGFGVAAAAGAVQYGIMFGTYHAAKRATVKESPAMFMAICYVAAVLGHMAQYPLHYIRRDVREINSRQQRFGGLSYRHYLSEARRKIGLSVVYSGYFKSKPLLMAFSPAMLIGFYDVTTRSLGTR